MGEQPPGTPPPASAREDRLDSWKEIAAYLNRDVTTVQRWEKRESMPVHRHLHDRMGSVYASRAELDAWVHSRNLRGVEENSEPVAASVASAPPVVPAPPRAAIRNQRILSAAAVGLGLALGAGYWARANEFFWRSPVADARFQSVTDFDGVEQAATSSRDGRFVALLSDRDGTMDVWVTQVGSGQFHNLTRGSAPELVDPSVRRWGSRPTARS